MKEQVMQSNQTFECESQLKSLRKIGAGGYGSIYNNDQQSVVKLVWKKEETASQVKSILNEIAIYKYLLNKKTPNVLRAKQYIDNESVLGIILDKGHISLNDFLKRHRQGMGEMLNGTQTLFSSYFLYLVKQVIVAIEQLGNSGVIHCDIKAQNIMLGFELHGGVQIFLIDFGLSQLAEEVLPSVQNSTQLQVLSNPSKSSIKGTDTLIDPQMIWNASTSQYCDLWSLGVALLQMFVMQDFKFLEIKCLQKMKQLNNKEIILQTIIQKQLETVANPHIKHIICELLKISIESRDPPSKVINSLKSYIQGVIGSNYQPAKPIIAFPGLVEGGLSLLVGRVPIIRGLESIFKGKGTQKINIYHISDQIVVQSKPQSDTIVITLQGEVFFNNNEFFTQMADRLKQICTKYQFPVKLKQRIVPFWNVLFKLQVPLEQRGKTPSSDRKHQLIYLKLQYTHNTYTETVFVSFNTQSKMNVMASQDLMDILAPRYAKLSQSQVVQSLKKEPIPITIYQDLKISADLSNHSINADLLDQFAVLLKMQFVAQ